MQSWPSAYGWLMLAGIFVSLATWMRLGRKDPRLVRIYLGGLLGAMFGAKVVFLLAEGWLHLHDPNRWLVLATGKSILGALLGGYLGVEFAKHLLAYRAPTGDLFALVVPLGLMFGRVGCVLHGCCLGREMAPAWYAMRDSFGHPRWPAAPVEHVFNFCALALLALLRKGGFARHQLFHLYLISYGLFRFAHEPWRDTPRIAGGFTGYQGAALVVAGWGVWGFLRRAKLNEASSPLRPQASPAVSGCD